jgi:hypothetical protein
VKRPPKILERPAFNEGEQDKKEDKYTQHMRKLAESAKSMEATQQTNPSSTKAVAVSQLKRRNDIQAKRKEEEAAKIAEAERIEKQNALKGTVQSALKSKFGKSSSEVISEAAKEKRKAMREQEEKQKAALEAAVKKGRNRPMLLETSAADHKASSNLSFLKATKKMIELLESQGEKPDKYLSLEQKELLEEEKMRNELKEKQKH